MESKQVEAEGAMAKMDEFEPAAMETSNVLSEVGKEQDTSKLESKLSEKNFNEQGMFIRNTGISWWLCALFLVGNMAGGGIVSIPLAMKETFMYPGLLIGLLVAGVSMWTSILIGKCWAILQQRYPEYRSHCREVYAEIGKKAVGTWMKHFVSVIIDINQFGISVIYLLLSSKSIFEAINVFTKQKSPLDFCVIIVILAAVLLPFTFAKSPADFSWAVFGGMLCSFGAVILIIVGSGMDYGLCSQGAWIHKKPETLRILSALGTFVFAFGGHSSFPTLQHDMKRPFEFTKSTYLAFALITMIYLPMAFVTNLAYGTTIGSSIINSVQNVYVQQTINLAIMAHCLLTFILVINPFNQSMEELVHAHQHFGWQRILIRSGTMFAILFVSLSLPNFGPLLDLVGASTTLLTVLVLPVLFYLFLNASGNMNLENKILSTPEKNKDVSEPEASTAVIEEYPLATAMDVLRHNNKLLLVGGGLCMLFGIVVGLISSGAAIANLVGLGSDVFQKPCYVRWFTGGIKEDLFPTYCCGINGNLHQPGMTGTCKSPFVK